jgi:hypothetical protein
MLIPLIHVYSLTYVHVQTCIQSEYEQYILCTVHCTLYIVQQWHHTHDLSHACACVTCVLAPTLLAAILLVLLITVGCRCGTNALTSVDTYYSDISLSTACQHTKKQQTALHCYLNKGCTEVHGSTRSTSNVSTTCSRHILWCVCCVWSAHWWHVLRRTGMTSTTTTATTAAIVALLV